MSAPRRQPCGSISSEGERSGAMPTTTCFDLIVYARLLGRQLFTREIDAATAAARLLQTLLHCAHLHQGALLLCLSEQQRNEVAHIVELHFSSIEGVNSRERLYLLASQGVSMQYLLQMLPVLHTRKTPLGQGCISYALPITLPSQGIQEALACEQVDVPGEEVPAPFFHLPSSATLLMLQPTGEAQHDGEQCSLPLCVQEAAGVALMTMFLAIFSLYTAPPGVEFIQAESQDTLSHELRSPLAAIKGYTNTLLRHEQRIPPEERREFLQEIDDASNHLASLIDHLIELSQLETGTLPFAFSPLNLKALAEQALRVAQARWEESGYGDARAPRSRFSLHLEEEESLGEPLVYGDHQRLREVVDMLLDNAVKYSPQGGEIEVIMRCPIPTRLLIEREQSRLAAQRSIREACEPIKAFIELCVRDHGIGIPPHQLQRIFHRFHRVDMSLTREVSGLGLGLTLCKHIVHRHRGRIWIESKLGAGSTVHVLLPAYGEEVICSL